jgi:outer membrane protein assembly factor BamB
VIGADLAAGAVLSDARVYVVTLSGEVVALAKDVGTMLWGVPLTSPVAARLVGDGQGLIVGLEDGSTVYVR